MLRGMLLLVLLGLIAHDMVSNDRMALLTYS